jgi:hypothetical protein
MPASLALAVRAVTAAAASQLFFHATAHLLKRDQGGVPCGSCLSLMQKGHDLREGRKGRRVMLRYVMSPMAPEGVSRDVVAARYVAIWQSGQLGFDIRAFGVPADAAFPGHAITLQTPRPDTGDRSSRRRKMAFQRREACCAG